MIYMKKILIKMGEYEEYEEYEKVDQILILGYFYIFNQVH